MALARTGANRIAGHERGAVSACILTSVRAVTGCREAMRHHMTMGRDDETSYITERLDGISDTQRHLYNRSNFGAMTMLAT